MGVYGSLDSTGTQDVCTGGRGKQHAKLKLHDKAILCPPGLHAPLLGHRKEIPGVSPEGGAGKAGSRREELIPG